jgi:hypothetical protein
VEGSLDMHMDELKRRLTPEVRERILRENWHSHDARWFLKVGMECGFEVPNKLNQATLKSMVRTEMRRLLQAVGSPEVKSAGDFAELVGIACEVYFPPPMLEPEVKSIAVDSVAGVIKRCIVHEEVSRAGVAGIYECACGYRHEGWLEACGLRGDVRIVKSMLRGDPACEISVSSVSRGSGDESS